MQVHQGNREKKIAKYGVKLLRLKLGKKASDENVHDYLVDNDSDLKKLVTVVDKVGDSILPPYQRRRVKGYGELSIWIALNHPKMRPVFIKSINRVTKYHIDKSNLPKVKLSLIEQKLMMKVFSYVARKIMDGRYKAIREDLMTASNKSVKEIFLQTNSAINSIIGLSDSEKAAVTVLVDCGLWTMTHDTAYRDAFFWTMDNVGCSTLRELIKNHPITLVKEPEHWYPNVWWYGKKLTRQKIKNGELSPGQFSEIEKHCVSNIQERLLNQGR